MRSCVRQACADTAKANEELFKRYATGKAVIAWMGAAGAVLLLAGVWIAVLIDLESTRRFRILLQPKKG